jgi:hypothetical protein
MKHGKDMAKRALAGAPPSFTDLTQMKIERYALRMAWDELLLAEKRAFLKAAQKEVNKEMTELAIKCVKEADEAMSAPDYVSRADPEAYSDERKKRK